MTRRKIAAFLMAATMVTSMGAMTANANNHADTVYAFNFNQSERRTDYREKEDDSSSYMKCIVQRHPIQHMYMVTRMEKYMTVLWEIHISSIQEQCALCSIMYTRLE